jgi:hypothetical protein
LPSGGVERLLITPAAEEFNIASHGPGVTAFTDGWQDENGTCLMVRVQPAGLDVQAAFSTTRAAPIKGML